MSDGWEYPAKVEYRLRYFIHNDRPHTCFFCGEEVPASAVQVHHKDGDHHNDQLENLVAAHKECHDHFHANNPGYSTRDRQCPWCKTWFTPRRSTGVFCSDAHRAAATRARLKRARQARRQKK